MRLIDGNKIVMSLADWWYSSFGQEETEESRAIKKAMDQVEKMVMEMPEIVRCKECRNRHRQLRCAGRHPNWFCADGVKQVTGKLNNPDDSLLTDDSEACKEQKSKLESDLISRQAAIEAVANHFMTDALIRNPSASNDIEDWKKIAERILSNLPPVTPKEQQEHGRLIDADYLLQETFTVDEEEWTTPEIRAILENAPPVEPKRPKGTETMIVDGMEIEIDPVSYEVGYTHGQFSERPKGEWIKATGVAPPEFAGRYVCSNCSSYALMNMPYGSRQKLSPFCPNCGADMRGDKE